MKRTARIVAASLSAAALALTLVGCGGDDSKDDKAQADPTSAETTEGGDGADEGSDTLLTQEEFVEQANAICKAQDEAEEAAFTAVQEAAAAEDTATADAKAKELATVIRGEADAIGGLQAPESMIEDVTELLAGLNAALEQIDAEGVTALQANVLAEPSQQASALGLTECGN